MVRHLVQLKDWHWVRHLVQLKDWHWERHLVQLRDWHWERHLVLSRGRQMVLYLETYLELDWKWGFD